VAVALTSSIGRNKRRNHFRSTGSRASNGGGAQDPRTATILATRKLPNTVIEFLAISPD